MARQRPRRVQNVFESNQSLDFAVFPATFQRGLRELALYVDWSGGAPSPSARGSNGFEVGKWLHEIQRVPHVLDLPQRAVLLSVPGVRLSEFSGSEPVQVPGDPARQYLWHRLRLWASDPADDPVHARRAAATNGSGE